MISILILIGSLQSMYYAEPVDYIFLYNKPLPEYTKYKCKNNRAIKYKYGYIRNHKGKHIYCETKTLTRRQYENLITY